MTADQDRHLRRLTTECLSARGLRSMTDAEYLNRLAELRRKIEAVISSYLDPLRAPEPKETP